MKKLITTCIAVFLSSSAMLQAAELSDEQQDYISANTIGIFYHELGHALIDILQVPIFGQEEDAADVLSILMVDYEFKSSEAESIAYDMALTFESDAQQQADQGEVQAFWDVHGSDQQRFFNTVCLFYGGDVSARQDFAESLGLPEDRAVQCEEERALADDSWGPILDTVTNEDTTNDGISFVDVSTDNSPAVTVLVETVHEEVAQLNAWLDIPRDLTVRVEDCGEVNAFYEPQETVIIMCSEFAGHLAAQLSP